MQSDRQRAWALDQLQKSVFFHQKLHEWRMLEIADAIERVSGASLAWELQDLQISDVAWNKIIHSGVKPIIVFAHPDVLTTVAYATSYYRMLAMVSQKSMGQIGLATTRFEQKDRLPPEDTALAIARRVNRLVSTLIEMENDIAMREFDIWRGMAAGSQAQGSWQNRKGDQTELMIRLDLLTQLKAAGLLPNDMVVDVATRVVEIHLNDGRTVRLGAEPDIKIYNDFRIHAAVEVKGGIDPAGVLERVGAAIKSLSRAKDESPGAITILVMPAISMSEQAKIDIDSNKANVNYWFSVEDILEDSESKRQYYSLLGLGTY